MGGRRRQRALPGIGHRRRRRQGGVREAQRVESLLAPRGARLVGRVELLEVGEADRQVDQPLAQLERGNRRLRAQRRLDRTELPKQRGAEAEEQRRANVTDALRAAADDRCLALEPLVERGGRRLPQRGGTSAIACRTRITSTSCSSAASSSAENGCRRRSRRGPSCRAAARARLGVPLARRAERRRQRPARPEEVGLRRRAAHARHDALEEAAKPAADRGGRALVLLLLLGHRLGHGGRSSPPEPAEPTDAGEMGESGGGRPPTSGDTGGVRRRGVASASSCSRPRSATAHDCRSVIDAA